MTTLSDLDCLGLTIWGEARGEPIEGKIAVGNVIRNRYRSGKWGATYASVCLSPLQFSCWSAPGSNTGTVKALATQVMQGKPPRDPVLAECYWIAQGIQQGALQDNTTHATHYFVTASAIPSWAVGQVPVQVYGHQSFFARIA